MEKALAQRRKTPKEDKTTPLLTDKSWHSASGSVQKKKLKLVSPVGNITRSKTVPQRKVVIQKSSVGKNIVKKYSPKIALRVKLRRSRKMNNLQVDDMDGEECKNGVVPETSTSNGNTAETETDISVSSKTSSCEEFKGFSQTPHKEVKYLDLNVVQLTETTDVDILDAKSSSVETNDMDSVNTAANNDGETVESSCEVVNNGSEAVDNHSEAGSNETDVDNDSITVDDKEIPVDELHVYNSTETEGENSDENVSSKENEEEQLLSASTQTSATNGYKNDDDLSSTFKTPRIVSVTNGDKSDDNGGDDDKKESYTFLDTSKLLNQPLGEYLSKYVSPRPPLRKYQSKPFENFYKEKLSRISRDDTSAGTSTSSDTLVESSTGGDTDVTTPPQTRKRVFQSYLDETENYGDNWKQSSGNKKPCPESKKTCSVM